MNRLHRRDRAVVVVLISLACSSGSQLPEDQSRAPVADSTEIRLMQTGLTQLYEKSDPYAAEATFRELLRVNPKHYGAHFQLATALDRAGMPTDARRMWETVLQLAESSRDSATVSKARARLAAPDTVSEAAMMAAGLHLLYAAKNPEAAADQFRNVLAKNPTHYGATYQLAVSLDRAQHPDQAKPLWVKVLGMATAYKDEKTADSARARLRQNP